MGTQSSNKTTKEVATETRQTVSGLTRKVDKLEALILTLTEKVDKLAEGTVNK